MYKGIDELDSVRAELQRAGINLEFPIKMEANVRNKTMLVNQAGCEIVYHWSVIKRFFKKPPKK